MEKILQWYLLIVGGPHNSIDIGSGPIDPVILCPSEPRTTLEPRSIGVRISFDSLSDAPIQWWYGWYVLFFSIHEGKRSHFFGSFQAQWWWTNRFMGWLLNWAYDVMENFEGLWGSKGPMETCKSGTQCWEKQIQYQRTITAASLLELIFFFLCLFIWCFFLPFTVVIYHHLGPHHLGYIFGSFFFSTEQANFRSFGKQIEGFLRQISNIQRHPPITNFAEFCRDGIFSPWNDNSIFAAFQKTGPFLHLRGKDRWWPSNDFIFFGATFANFGMVFSAEIFSFTQGIGCER